MPWPIRFTVGAIPTRTNPWGLASQCCSPCLTTSDALGTKSYLCLRNLASSLPSAWKILPQTAMGWFLTSFGYFSVCLVGIFNTAPPTFCNLPTHMSNCYSVSLCTSIHSYCLYFSFSIPPPLPEKHLYPHICLGSKLHKDRVYCFLILFLFCLVFNFYFSFSEVRKVEYKRCLIIICWVTKWTKLIGYFLRF